jgi:hypothetical protein
MHPIAALAVRITIPAEAVVPLIICVAILGVLTLGGNALATFKQHHPGAARIVGYVAGVLCSALTIYWLMQIIPQIELYDPVHAGISLASPFDALIAGFIATMSVIMWGWARQRWLALAFGLGVGVALFIKPFVFAMRDSTDGHLVVMGMDDPEHLSYFGGGLVVLVTALIVLRLASIRLSEERYARAVRR